MAKTRKQIRAAEEILEARGAISSVTPAMLGQGKKKGGGAQCQKARLEALNRVRSCAVITVTRAAERLAVFRNGLGQRHG